MARSVNQVAAAFPTAPRDRQLRELVRSQIGVMVNDVIAATQGATAAAGVATIADVRGAGRALAGFSPAMADAERALKRFMYANLYHHPSQMAAAEAGRDVVIALFVAYQGDPAAMGPSWNERLPHDDCGRARHIADFIAGMTDRFAIDRYAELFGHRPAALG